MTSTKTNTHKSTKTRKTPRRNRHLEYYTLKRCSKKEYCKQCRYVKFRGTMTKWPVQKLTHRTVQKHVPHHDATDIQKNYIFCVFRIKNNFF